MVSGIGRRVTTIFSQTQNRDGFHGFFRENVATGLGHGIPFSKQPNMLSSLKQFVAFAASDSVALGPQLDLGPSSVAILLQANKGYTEVQASG